MRGANLAAEAVCVGRDGFIIFQFLAIHINENLSKKAYKIR